MNPLRVTLVQTALHWENPDANLDMLTGKIKNLGGTDLVILPEMFTTGFSMKPEIYAASAYEKALSWMSRTAAGMNCTLTGSTMAEENGRFYNRLIWMRPDGSYETYDKRHLFSLSKEPEVYTAGSEKKVVTLHGWRICPLICYDLRFPVWSRNKENYDILLYVANWPERRIFAWKTLLAARAIENQSFTIGVNRVGDDGHGIYHSGDSMVFDAMGQILYQKTKEEDLITLSLNKSELNEIRAQLPFLSDADNFIVSAANKQKHT